MPNEIRGEREITLGSKTITVALTMGAIARIERAFGVDTFEEATPMLAKVVGEGESARLFPNVGNVVKFWQAVCEAHGVKIDFDRETINPYDATAAAIDLIGAAREAWFAGTREAADDGRNPLPGAPDGDTGFA